MKVMLKVGVWGLKRWLTAFVALAEDPDSVPRTCSGSQSCITPVPRNLIPSYDQCRPQAHSWYTYIHVSKMLIHPKLNKHKSLDREILGVCLTRNLLQLRQMRMAPLSVCSLNTHPTLAPTNQLQSYNMPECLVKY